MKSLILAILIAQSPQIGPGWNEAERPVPYPIPADICVEAHITEKGRKAGSEYKIKFYEAPQDSNDLYLLEEMRKRGLAILKRCKSADS